MIKDSLIFMGIVIVCFIFLYIVDMISMYYVNYTPYLNILYNINNLPETTQKSCNETDKLKNLK